MEIGCSYLIILYSWVYWLITKLMKISLYISLWSSAALVWFLRAHFPNWATIGLNRAENGTWRTLCTLRWFEWTAPQTASYSNHSGLNWGPGRLVVWRCLGVTLILKKLQTTQSWGTRGVVLKRGFEPTTWKHFWLPANLLSDWSAASIVSESLCEDNEKRRAVCSTLQTGHTSKAGFQWDFSVSLCFLRAGQWPLAGSTGCWPAPNKDDHTCASERGELTRLRCRAASRPPFRPICEVWVFPPST